ncbi:MAG: hypothetical protein ACXW07_06760 [Nitrososphaeraceae archaeon]
MPLIEQNLKYLSLIQIHENQLKEENDDEDPDEFETLPYNRLLFEDLPEQEFARYNLAYLTQLVIILIYLKKKKNLQMKMIYYC